MCLCVSNFDFLELTHSLKIFKSLLLYTAVALGSAFAAFGFYHHLDAQTYKRLKLGDPMPENLFEAST